MSTSGSSLRSDPSQFSIIWTGYETGPTMEEIDHILSFNLTGPKVNIDKNLVEVVECKHRQIEKT